MCCHFVDYTGLQKNLYSYSVLQKKCRKTLPSKCRRINGNDAQCVRSDNERPVAIVYTTEQQHLADHVLVVVQAVGKRCGALALQW